MATPANPTPASERTFGWDHFDGVPLGVTHSQLGPATGMAMDGCPLDGDYRYSEWPGRADEAPWVLWSSGVTTDPGTGEALATEFGLQAGPLAGLDSPYGPVGPSGLQLGTSTESVIAAFPDAVTSEYLAEYFNEVYTLYSIDRDGVVMVIATRDDVVVDIRWGAPSVATGWVHERCSEGPAPFNWESEPGT
ncbi:MAG: hypothetical protein CVT64_05665 [Actinobacteria bacterium HGW-Actinobacteria-4]|nr:MAG: hypothetical protein CVT64_05665 [Actinobacteria bacterium HGW-Actinobacteria-4]